MMQHLKHLLLSALMLMPTLVVQAQVAPTLLRSVPMDTAIRYGVLPNGLVYYICPTQAEKNSANFYLLQRSGSAHEAPHAHGVAHFVEHMAMRSTKHFPNQSGFNYLRSIGVNFGIDVNAFTSFDRTFYVLPRVLSPTGGCLDSCLLLLSDWGSAVSFEPELVERERSVILEEERLRFMDASARREMGLYQARLAGSAYAHLPIGDMEVVAHCTPQLLRDYYTHWYQPQLQGVVVVGDVDVQEVEEQITKHFGQRERGATEACTPPLPVHTGTRAFGVPYPALPYVSLVVSMTKPYHSQSFYQSVEGLIEQQKQKGMLNDLRDSLQAWKNYGGVAGVMDVDVSVTPDYQGIAVAEHLNLVIKVQPEHWRTALASLLTRLELWRRYGLVAPMVGDTIQLTEAEALAMVGELPLTSYTGQQPAEEILKRCIGHFNGQALLSDATTEELENRVSIRKMVAARSTYFATYYKPEHTEIIVYHPTDSAIAWPTSVDLLALYDSVRASTIAPHDTIYVSYEIDADSTANATETEARERFVDLRMPFPLSPVAGKLVKRKVNKHKWVEYHLSNGVRVVHLPDTASGFRLNAFRPGGLSSMADADVPAGLLIEQVSREFGGYYSNMLWKNPPHVRTKRTNNAADFWEIVGADNLEDLLQATHLFLTSAVVDSAKVAELQQQQQLLRGTLEQEPSFRAMAFQDEHHYVNADRRANRRLYSGEYTIDKATLERLLQEHRSNYNGLTVVLTGSLKPKRDLPLLLKYLGSLPSKAEPCKVTKHLADHYKPYNDTLMTHITHDEPLTISYITLHQEDDFAKDHIHLAHGQVLGRLLKDALIERIRFEQGLVYSLDVELLVDRYITDFQNMTMGFACHPKDYAHVLTLIEQTLESLPTHPLLTEDWLQQYISKQVAHCENDPQTANIEAAISYYYDGEQQARTKKEAYQQITIDSLRQFIHSWLKHSRRYVSTYTTEERAG